MFANRFVIDRPAGSGGMGVVYRALDQHSSTYVALKLLSGPDGSPEAGDVDRFTREAELLRELHHPGIVSYVTHGQAAAGQCFLAMEWLDGEDLGTRLTRGPLAVRECVTLMVQIADALAIAHQRGIIHRDRRDKHKIWLRNGYKAIHRRRTDDAFLPLPHCPS